MARSTMRPSIASPASATPSLARMRLGPWWRCEGPTRATWELKLEQEVGEDVSILGLINRKVNLSRKHAPIGLKVTQSEENTRIQYEPFDLSQAAELKSSLPWPNQIRNLLEDGEPRSSRQIAEALGAKIGVITTTLSNPRYKGHKWHMVGEGKAVKWTVVNA